MTLAADTVIVVFVAGLILLLGLLLGVWKYRQILTSPERQAHIYVDIAHRAALMYSFATLVLAALVELSGFPAWLNLILAGVPVVFFLGAIASYCLHGALRDTENQFARPDPLLRVAMIALIVGEIGGVVGLLAGVVAGQWA